MHLDKNRLKFRSCFEVGQTVCRTRQKIAPREIYEAVRDIVGCVQCLKRIGLQVYIILWVGGGAEAAHMTKMTDASKLRLITALV